MNYIHIWIMDVRNHITDTQNSIVDIHDYNTIYATSLV